MVGSGEKARGGEEGPARIVGDFQRRGRGGRRDAAGSEQDRAPRGPVLLRDLGQLVADERSELVGIVQDLRQLGDGDLEPVLSDSSSSLLNFVSRRSGMSRM